MATAASLLSHSFSLFLSTYTHIWVSFFLSLSLSCLTHATVANGVQLGAAINVAQCLTCYTVAAVLRAAHLRGDFLNFNAGYLRL